MEGISARPSVCCSARSGGASRSCYAIGAQIWTGSGHTIQLEVVPRQLPYVGFVVSIVIVRGEGSAVVGRRHCGQQAAR